MALQLTFTHPLPPAEERQVRAWFEGNVTDKQIAAALNISPRAVADTWQRLCFRLRLPIMANRQHAIIALLDRGWIEVTRAARVAAVLLLCTSMALANHDQFRRSRRSRTRREIEFYQQEERAAA